jgi:hypothetical protein
MMNNHAEGAASAAGPTPSIFANRYFQALAVPVALELMMSTVQRCRYMMHDMQAPSIFSQPAVGRSDSKLTVRERKELDLTLSLYWRELEERSKLELEVNGPEENESSSAGYPLAEETARTIQSIVLRNIGEQVGSEHFSKYQNDPVKLAYLLANIRLGSKEDRESTIGVVLVPFLVSKIEEFLGALVRVTLFLYPKTLGEPPGIPNLVFQQYKGDPADIERWQGDQTIAELIKQAPAEWRSTIKKRMKIDIGEVSADWPRINEIIQRRHAIIHNGGMADSDYLKRVDGSLADGVLPGDPLSCSASYVAPVLVEVEAWSICLAMVWAKHYFGSEARYHPLVIDKVVELERSGNWTHALAILNAFLAEPLPSSSSEISLGKINRWYCLQELGRQADQLTAEIAAWSPQDADETDKLMFAAGRAALLRDYKELTELIRRGIGRGLPGFQKQALASYPLFKRAMEESAQVAKLLRGASAPQRQAPHESKRRYKN